jgi:hypothetical protein
MRKFRLLLAVVVTVSLLTPVVAAGQQGSGPPQFSQAALQSVIATQERYTPQLVGTPLVVGTGVSVDASGRGVVKVYTRSAGARGIPPRLDGVPVVVQVTGEFFALQQANGKGNGKGGGNGGGNGKGKGNGGGSSFDRTARYRPAPIGVSTGHPDITAGTIGARVRDAGGNLYALSNNHVYANVNAANIGDNVLQPGTYDGGQDPADAFGTLFNFEPLLPGIFDVNYIDAAIALSSAGELDNGTPPDGYGIPRTQIVAPAINMPVMKYGRTTGFTTGNISDINVFTIVGYGPDYYLWFDGQIMISGNGFSAGGDSGSLIVDNDRHPVGLLFAGSDTSTLANPIAFVLAAFNVTIDGEG